jgi:hypothetical protein
VIFRDTLKFHLILTIGNSSGFQIQKEEESKAKKKGKGRERPGRICRKSAFGARGIGESDVGAGIVTVNTLPSSRTPAVFSTEFVGRAMESSEPGSKETLGL